MRVNTGGGGANGASMAPTTATTGDDGQNLCDEASPLRGVRAGRLGSSLAESPTMSQREG